MASIKITPKESTCHIDVDGTWSGDIKISYQKPPKDNEVSITSCPVFIEPGKRIEIAPGTIRRHAYFLLTISKLMSGETKTSTQEQIVEVELPEDDVLI